MIIIRVDRGLVKMDKNPLECFKREARIALDAILETIELKELMDK